MNVDFEKSVFTTSYAFQSPRSIIRTLSDSFSKQHCDTSGAAKYAAEKTKGCCIYCGEAMYKLSGIVPVFSNTIHYDHIYPASKLNLFEVGNVALACVSCNLEKSDRMPMEYYKMRLAENKKVFIENEKAFELFLKEFTNPYRIKWPEYYSLNFIDVDEETQMKHLLRTLFFDKVEIAVTSSKYNHENSINKEVWDRVVEVAFENYAPLTAKDVEGRVGFANSFFESIIGYDVHFSDITVKEFKKFVNSLLEDKKSSKNEFQKYRMFIKILIDVLNEDYMKGQLKDFYKEVPTYSKMNKETD